MKSIIKGLLFFFMSVASLTAYAEQAYKRPSDAVIKQKLSTIQYNVTQQQGTESPFNNAYWNNEEQGIYVDVVTGEPLFISL
ncbi:TPA: peptide-methionine (R)-S-oxide reductase, partial [Legionella pneumophila]|nr:peptide-methionine (R)-S-oxide reductase [Legionella pneumophila]HAU1398059.1 peptide-methionine (R)-S-oxide reductase [Legionella pneumophila]HCC3249494.1 peptide-methionine (R)-S-oxide reductase [Legionella pneumophila]HEH5931245.1 peptide-methionine (R)-S-oxide reductase [Legionella pneumophila]HEH5937632.1 peptide-methionine (R)-S-oxide reductase [Legionella pneumophila]